MVETENSVASKEGEDSLCNEEGEEVQTTERLDYAPETQQSVSGS